MGDGSGMWLGLLMATMAGLLFALVVVAYALRKGKQEIALRVGTAALIWCGIYLGVLITVSATSRERVLGLNAEKRFCGFYLDCHLAVSVVEVRTEKALGNPSSQVSATGTFYVVTTRIASDAKQATLKPFDLWATVVDGQGREYERSAKGELALERARGSRVAFEQPVAVGGFYTKELVFDLPANAERPALLVTEGSLAERVLELFLIGDEDSLAHRKTLIRLEGDG